MSKFVDTNILLYAVSHAQEESAKTKIARELLASGTELHISVQCLTEFSANAIKPTKLGMTRNETVLYCKVWRSRFRVHEISETCFELATKWFVPGHLSLWDALIVAAANLAGCSELISEDLHHGQVFDAVRVANPFNISAD